MKPCVLLVLSLVLSSPCAAQYSFTTVDYPGAVITRLVGLNDHGEAVGNYVLAGTGQVRHAFKYSRGRFEALDAAGVLGTHESAANQINNRGDITGWYTDGTRHGYVLRDGVVHTVDYPGATYTQVNGVSDTGIVFGHFRIGSEPYHGFILQDGFFTQVDFPGGLNTYPYYINARGDIAGNYNDLAGGTGHGFVLSKEGTWIGFDAPGAAPNSTLAIGINDRRQILGSCRGINGQARTFLVALDDVLSTGGYTFIDLAEGPVTPETMNDAGMFVGIYADAAGTHGLIANPAGGWRD